MHSSAWKEHTAPGGVRRFVFFSVLTFSEFQKAAPCSREIEAGVGRVSIFLLFSNDVFSYFFLSKRLASGGRCVIEVVSVLSSIAHHGMIWNSKVNISIVC